jgi:hypothetical protein
MNRVPSASPAGFPGPLASRRSLLRGGALLGLSAAAGAGCSARPQGASPASAGQAGTRTGGPTQAERLILDYQPSQVTGWSPPYSPTLGGHLGSTDFTWHGQAYRVSLLPFGQRGGAPDPLYEGVPADATIKFTHTLARKWGKYYTFRYLGGLDSGARFTVESYGAFHGKPLNRRQSGVIIGADLFVVYHPGRSRDRPVINSDLQFIQVAYYRIGMGLGDNLVDTDRANPFYGEGGGLTSIDGDQSVSFSDFVRQGFGGQNLPPNLFMAETFLAQDTRMKDAAGKDIVKIFGGVKWGWQMQRVQA